MYFGHVSLDSGVEVTSIIGVWVTVGVGEDDMFVEGISVEVSFSSTQPAKNIRKMIKQIIIIFLFILFSPSINASIDFITITILTV